MGAWVLTKVRQAAARTAGFFPQPYPHALGVMRMRIKCRRIARLFVMNFSDEEIQQLLRYARDKFEEERFPFAATLRPVRRCLPN
jgi:hypothetical protein